MHLPRIALVNSDDVVIGFEDKDRVHAQGLLHRAFSILICNTNGQMLIHQRAFNKYHSPGLWTNACCSHLTEGDVMENVIHERLQHEMGISCPLEHLFTFHYTIKFDNGLTENEIDWVYLGRYDGFPNPNPSEVASWKWVDIPYLLNDISENPRSYTYWFKHILSNYSDKILTICSQNVIASN